MRKFLPLVFSILLCQSAGLVGSFFTLAAIPGWYAHLNKPSFSPPNFIFAPVWLTLYTIMGISLFLIWQKGSGRKEVRRAIAVFLSQLALNTLWSIIFFGLKELFVSLMIIGLLWLMIVATIVKFYRLDRRTAYLLFPYLVWVSFATLLNFSIWTLNR